MPGPRVALRHGVRRFVCAVGHLRPAILDYFGDGAKWNCEIRHAVESSPAGTGGALKIAAPLLEEQFLVLNGDNYLEMDYGAFTARLASHPESCGMLACWKNDPPRYQSNVALDAANVKILDYRYGDPSGKTYVDCGAKVFSKKLFSYFPSKEAFSLEVDVLPAVAEAGGLLAYPVPHPPLSIGTPEELAEARRVLAGLGSNSYAAS